MNEIIETKIDYKGKEIKLQTGKLAPQADMAVLAQMGETTVLATVVYKPSKEDPGFLPLRVDYEEKLYAGGIIKGARWIKREGRPSDEATVISRLIDHAIRPLFPKDLRDDVQLVVTVLSVDEENNPEILSLIAASAALNASSIPFEAPFASIHLGYLDDKLVANPKIGELEKSDLDLVISYLEDERVQAMEASVNLLPDEKIKEAIKTGYDEVKPVFNLIRDFVEKAGKEKVEYTPFSPSEDVYNEIKEKYDGKMRELVSKPKQKPEFWTSLTNLKDEIIENFREKHEEDLIDEAELAVDKLQAYHLRKLALEDKKRIDGRDLDEVRGIASETNIVPRVHGSALFSRELTQVLSITTLGSPANSLLRETLWGEEESRYFHHYVALGFSTGEPRPIRGPGRREIGHGMLAQRALMPVLPSTEEFPYVIRVVSEVLSQNGSSSMASVCGSSLSLMEAGVPIKSPVSGISIGLITDEGNEKFEILSDIQGAEDFAGFMDFKMAGTEDAVTAIQMDIKLAGIPLNLFDKIIDASKKARLEVLEEMNKTISSPRTELKSNAPRIHKVVIEKDQIGLIIGSGGKTIKEIEQKTGASLDIIEEEDKGIVVVMSTDAESLKGAVTMVERLVEEPEVGKVYEGAVTKVLDFGALVEFLPGREGLIHVSEISDEYIEKVTDYLNEDDVVKVKLKDIDKEKGRYVLTLRFEE